MPDSGTSHEREAKLPTPIGASDEEPSGSAVPEPAPKRRRAARRRAEPEPEPADAGTEPGPSAEAEDGSIPFDEEIDAADIEDRTSVASPFASGVDVGTDIFAARDSSMPDLEYIVTRRWPLTHLGRPCRGYLGTHPAPFGMAEIKRLYGGGTYAVVEKYRGKFRRAARALEVQGRPKFPPPDADDDGASYGAAPAATAPVAQLPSGMRLSFDDLERIGSMFARGRGAARDDDDRDPYARANDTIQGALKLADTIRGAAVREQASGASAVVLELISKIPNDFLSRLIGLGEAFLTRRSAPAAHLSGSPSQRSPGLSPPAPEPSALPPIEPQAETLADAIYARVRAGIETGTPSQGEVAEWLLETQEDVARAIAARTNDECLSFLATQTNEVLRPHMQRPNVRAWIVGALTELRAQLEDDEDDDRTEEPEEAPTRKKGSNGAASRGDR